jgi:hypothetical protein
MQNLKEIKWQVYQILLPVLLLPSLLKNFQIQISLNFY